MLSFSFNTKVRGASTNLLAIFVSASDSLIDLKDSVESALQRDVCPELCVLVGSWESKAYIKSLMADPEMIEAWRRWLPIGLHDHFCAMILQKNKSIQVQGYLTDDSINLWDKIIRRGAGFLFEKNGGLLVAGPMWHYIKPSGKHTNVFIRTANVLIDGCEIEFLALGLFRMVAHQVTTIYCDTSGIHSLAYALKRMIELANPKEKLVAVSSFRSYHGYIDTVMDDVATSAILISASFSGDLNNVLLKEKNADQSRIATVYYAGELSTVGQMGVLCCLHRDSTVVEKVRFENENPNTGKFVKSGSMGLQIKGDAFLAEPARIDSHLIVAEDCPKWLSEYQGFFCGTGAIRSLKNNSSGEQVYDTWLSLEEAIANSSNYKSKLVKFLTENLPVRASQVVLGSSENSTLCSAMESLLRQFYPNCLYGYFNGRILRSCTRRLLPDPIVVVIPIVRSGQQILSLSRALRDIVCDRSIHYVVPVAMVESEAVCQELIANLSYSAEGCRNRVKIMITAFMPASRVRTPWHAEKDWYSSQIGTRGLERMTAWRRTLLMEDWSALGPRDQLYLPNKRHSELTLRKGFIFDRRKKKKNLSADELYFTISAVLHNLRKVKVGGPLKEDISRHTVLDSGNFDRYNDGAIQAAILRAALPREVDYSGCKDHSERLVSILRFALTAREKPHGDAAAEIALALAFGHLRLHVECKPSLDSAIRESGILRESSYLKYICQQITSV